MKEIPNYIHHKKSRSGYTTTAFIFLSDGTNYLALAFSL